MHKGDPITGEGGDRQIQEGSLASLAKETRNQLKTLGLENTAEGCNKQRLMGHPGGSMDGQSTNRNGDILSWLVRCQKGMETTFGFEPETHSYCILVKNQDTFCL